MEIYRNASSITSRATEASFTGDLQIGRYFQRPSPSRLVGPVATGPRTPEKVNPYGQSNDPGRAGGCTPEVGSVAQLAAGDDRQLDPGLELQANTSCPCQSAGPRHTLALRVPGQVRRVRAPGTLGAGLTVVGPTLTRQEPVRRVALGPAGSSASPSSKLCRRSDV